MMEAIVSIIFLRRQRQSHSQGTSFEGCMRVSVRKNQTSKAIEKSCLPYPRDPYGRTSLMETGFGRSQSETNEENPVLELAVVGCTTPAQRCAATERPDLPGDWQGAG